MAWQAVETIPFRVGADVAPARAAAIRDALLRRAMPLSRLVDGRLEPLATASLVADGAHRAVLTAAHVLEQASVGDLVIPLPRERALLLLRSARVRVAAHPQLDIALLWFVDRAIGERLSANWIACPLRAWCGEACAPLPRFYALAGYPAASARRAEGCVYMKPVVVFTGALDPLRFAYARTALRIDGIEIRTPELDGVSGATVWRIDDDAIGDADCVLRPAAIQVAFQHGRHLRGEPIGGAADLIARCH